MIDWLIDSGFRELTYRGTLRNSQILELIQSFEIIDISTIQMKHCLIEIVLLNCHEGVFPSFGIFDFQKGRIQVQQKHSGGCWSIIMQNSIHLFLFNKREP